MRILFLFLLLPHLFLGQIINIEQLRNGKNKKGLHGELAASFGATRNTRKIIRWSASATTIYQRTKTAYALFGNFSWLQINDTKIISNGFEHLRFTYHLSRRLHPEVLIQFQQNPIWDIDQRMLSGGGLLVNIFRKDSLQWKSGVYLLYEYEDLIQDPAIHNDLRISTSTSLTAQLQKSSLSMILYYQPLLSYFSDYRISGVLRLKFQLFKHLGWSHSFQINYDTRPPQNLPDLFYNYSSGITFDF